MKEITRRVCCVCVGNRWLGSTLSEGNYLLLMRGPFGFWAEAHLLHRFLSAEHSPRLHSKLLTDESVCVKSVSRDVLPEAS